MMFATYGKLTYYSDYCVAYVDKNLTDYFRSLIPKYKYVNPQKYPPHLTVIRKQFEVAPSHDSLWKKYQDMLVPVYYDAEIRAGGGYFYLDAYSPVVSAIRVELGLEPYRQGFTQFHITIGNNK